MTVATSRQASTVDASKFSHTPVLKKGNLERHDIRTAENPFVPVEVCQSSNLYLLPPKVCVCVYMCECARAISLSHHRSSECCCIA
jgi:hypothetical protein